MEENIDNDETLDLKALYEASDNNLTFRFILLKIVFIIDIVSAVIAGLIFFIPTIVTYALQNNVVLSLLNILLYLVIELVAIFLLYIGYLIAQSLLWYLFDIKIIRIMISTKKITKGIKDLIFNQITQYEPSKEPPIENWKPPKDLNYFG